MPKLGLKPIKKTFTVFTLSREVDGEVVEMTFSRQAQADQYKAILEHFGVTDAVISKEKRVTEI